MSTKRSSPGEWLTQPEQDAWRAWIAMSTVVPAAIERDLQRDSGLSGPDYRVLSTLSEKPEQRWPLKELADAVLWSRSRLSHHVDRMAQRGLVCRQLDPHDGRGCILALTERGREVLSAAAPLHVDSVRRLVVGLLDDDELEIVGRVARRLADHVQP